ncbi:MAG: hypothetical protein DRR16_21575, partial [Candidatus Parabeggiatoa sp. nov. 3]
KETTKKRGNHKGLPLRAVRRGNPLWLPFAVKYLFICASVLNIIDILSIAINCAFKIFVPNCVFFGVQNLFCVFLECKIYFACFFSFLCYFARA